MDEEFSQEEESFSFLLVLTRSETDITSVSSSYAAESSAANDMNQSTRDRFALNQEGFICIVESSVNSSSNNFSLSIDTHAVPLSGGRLLTYPWTMAVAKCI